MTSLAEAFGLGRGCFGREGVLRCTGTFPESHRLGFVSGVAVALVSAAAAPSAEAPFPEK